VINVAYAVRQTGTDAMLCGHKDIGIFKPFDETMPCRFITAKEAIETCEKLKIANGYRNLAPSAQTDPFPTDLEVVELITVAETLST
jgi:hypothetical protein